MRDACKCPANDQGIQGNNGADNLALWQIGEHAGFATNSHFSAEFKRLLGVTPREYRSRLGREPD